LETRQTENPYGYFAVREYQSAWINACIIKNPRALDSAFSSMVIAWVEMKKEKRENTEYSARTLGMPPKKRAA